MTARWETTPPAARTNCPPADGEAALPDTPSVNHDDRS